MRDKVTISHRGARYEIGRGGRFYGIWAAGTAAAGAPLEWWPDTRDGWAGAWHRFTSIETPGTIARVSRGAVIPRVGNAPLAAALLAAGVVCGIIGLFPGYLGGASLARQPAELVPHVIYLAAWTASAAGILFGGERLRAGALLGTGTSIVTFGLFFADVGTVIAEGAHLMGAGLVLGVVGWVGCAAGSAMGLGLRPVGAPGRPAGRETGVAAAVILAAFGAALAFAPSWDSYVLRTASGVTQTLTAGNAFANPGPVIAGDVAVMLALVAVAVAAAVWRPARAGAALLAGAVVPMAAQAVSALVQVSEGTSAEQFGISPAQAARAGLTIDSGVTAAFWTYCAFVVALIAACAWMAASRQSDPAPGAVLAGGVLSPPAQPGYVPSGAAPAPPADAPGGTAGAGA